MSTQVPHWPVSNEAEFIEQLFDWFAEQGADNHDEGISQLDHGLQAAHLAVNAGDTDSAIVAALLHDIGHLLLQRPPNLDDELTVDLEHEQVASNWLAQMFPESVTEPVREHVRAKRYLCTVEPAYGERLSPGSVRSLEVQGGPLGNAERQQFESLPYFEDAVTLRKRDEGAKVIGKTVPPLESYRDTVLSLLRS